MAENNKKKIHKSIHAVGFASLVVNECVVSFLL